VQRHDFAYDLPPELIAQTPLAARSASRLLVVESDAVCASGAAASPSLDASTTSLGQSASGGHSASRDCTMRDFPSLLRPGDLLVFNDTKVVAARLAGTKPSGGRVEIFLERVLAPREALVQLSASKPIREGLTVATAGGPVQVLGRQDGLWRVEVPGPALDFFEQWGEVPLPPYIHRTADANDRERYESIFAREPGAVAAPTASLHFDSELIARIEEGGVSRVFVTLHVGAGTFQPVRTDDLESHVMHRERVSVSAATWEAIEKTRAAGGRVVAVGTTVVRALESAALALPTRSGAAVSPAGSDTAPGSHTAIWSQAPSSYAVHQAGMPENGWSGETRLFIRPGFQFRVTDALLTNFHLPESTLLMLACAFAGKDAVLAAYRHAVGERYRFFSYGDAMFLTRARVTG
jgi:S-adenosylmethionine:tRNA ribosyltransferase-isomerase